MRWAKRAIGYCRCSTKASGPGNLEIVTRLSALEFGADEGMLAGALSSLYNLFATTRDTLRRTAWR